MRSLQIGNRFALTATHCLYDDDNEEVLPASSFSIMLGLHDRRKIKEPNRWLSHHKIKICIDPFHTRRQIRVKKIIVHEEFNDFMNDIALLRLGKNDPSHDLIHFITNSQKSKWISQSSALPVFLTLVKAFSTAVGMSMVSSA